MFGKINLRIEDADFLVSKQNKLIDLEKIRKKNKDILEDDPRSMRTTFKGQDPQTTRLTFDDKTARKLKQSTDSLSQKQDGTPREH